MIKKIVLVILNVLTIFGIFVPYFSFIAVGYDSIPQLSGTLTSKLQNKSISLTGWQYIRGVDANEADIGNSNINQIDGLSILIIAAVLAALFCITFTIISKKKSSNIVTLVSGFGLMCLVVFLAVTSSILDSMKSEVGSIIDSNLYSIESYRPGIGLIIGILAFSIAIIINILNRKSVEEENDDFGLSTFLFPIIALLSVAATAVVINTNTVVTLSEGGIKPFSASFLYMVLWVSILVIGYRTKNFYTLIYAGLIWITAFLCWVLPGLFGFEFGLLANAPVFTGLINLKTNSYMVLFLTSFIPIIISAGLSATAIIMLLRLRKKNEGREQKFTNFIERRKALVAGSTFIVVIGIILYWAFTVDLTKTIM